MSDFTKNILLILAIVGGAALTIHINDAAAQDAVIGTPDMEPAIIQNSDGKSVVCRLRATNPTPPSPWVPLSCINWDFDAEVPRLLNNDTGDLMLDGIAL